MSAELGLLLRTTKRSDAKDGERYAGRKPGFDPFLVEADGARVEYHQYSGDVPAGVKENGR
jgi:hypothetical protein